MPHVGRFKLVKCHPFVRSNEPDPNISWHGQVPWFLLVKLMTSPDFNRPISIAAWGSSRQMSASGGGGNQVTELDFNVKNVFYFGKERAFGSLKMEIFARTRNQRCWLTNWIWRSDLMTGRLGVCPNAQPVATRVPSSAASWGLGRGDHGDRI